MVNEEKVRIMAKTAFYEKEYQDEIKEGGYYKSDYICSHLLGVLGSISVAYVMILGLIGLYYMEFLLFDAPFSFYGKLGIGVLVVYFMIITTCTILAVRYYSKKYNQNRKKLNKYYQELKKLNSFYIKSKDGGIG